MFGLFCACVLLIEQLQIQGFKWARHTDRVTRACMLCLTMYKKLQIVVLVKCCTVEIKVQVREYVKLYVENAKDG